MLIKKLLKLDIVRFCLVGTLGFLINFTLLSILYKSVGLPIFVAQLVAAEIALFNNFLLHHHWTYKDNNVAKTLPKLIVQFHISSWTAIIGSAILVSAGVQYLKLNYLVALAISSVVALSWNFFWTKFVIWKRSALQPEGIEDVA